MINCFPKDSIIINKDVNFYSAHTNLCNMVIFIFVFLFTIISFLFIDVKRKKKAFKSFLNHRF